MTTTATQITSRDQWLAERAQDVTSTESAALYGLSPYVTEFELWHQKHSGATVDLTPTARMVWGTRLQDAIAAGVAEDMGWQAKRLDVYMRDEADRIGSSFDFEIVCRKRGRGLMEIKNVDLAVFRDEWIDGPSGIEGPQHIEMQVQHQMEVAGVDWCAIVALVGGNAAHVIPRDRDREIGQDIRRRVRAFWQSIEENRMPRPNYARDADFMFSLYGRADADVVLEADTETEDLLREYARLGAIGDERDAVKARILERIGRASKVLTSFGSLACGMTKESRGKEITPDMVGQFVGARAGFRQFRFTPKKSKNP